MNRAAPRDKPPDAFWRTRWAVGGLAMAVVAGWFLWQEHRAHLLGVLPFLIVLVCPLMHLFMHRGHHRHQGHDAGGASASSASPHSASGQDRS